MQEIKEHIATKKLVPQLRFKEFDDRMYSCFLEDIVTLKSGGTPSKDNAEYWNGNIPWISAASMLGKYYYKSERTITEEGLKKGSKLALKGSLLLLVRGSMLYNKIPIGITESDVAFNQDLKALIPNKNVNGEFLYQWFSAKQNFLLNLVSGTGIGAGKIDTDDLKTLKFVLPSLPEQTKIASFLTAVDDKLQALKQKLTLLEQYKKGVMQKIFAQELRFKDENGKNYPDWEEKKLGDVGTIISGLTYSPDDINEDGILVLRSSNVQNRRLSFQDNVYVKTSAFNPVKLNDILICVRNGSKHLIGKNTIIDKETAGVAFGAFMSVYRSEYNLYFFHFFDTDEYKNEVHKNLGATINSINGSDLKKFKIPFPSIEEQTKIASFLSAIDEKIEKTTQQLTQTETFKKGLLQQMFV
jgi:type I restriction enzyme S subunit